LRRNEGLYDGVEVDSRLPTLVPSFTHRTLITISWFLATAGTLAPRVWP